MIYVCRVDTGTRHIFDLADGIENVGALANQIESQFKIDKSKQILLISGGEVLDDHQRKFYGFGFGCEESPIYLIDKSNVERAQPPTVELPLDTLCQDMRQDLDTAILMRPSFSTIQTRALLTHKINELDKNIVKICQSYYHDQYWQYQGYLTLIANLDEFLSSFRKKVQAIQDQFEFYVKNSKTYKDLMKEINKYIEILSRVPLLPSLMMRFDETGATSSGPAELQDLSGSSSNTSQINHPMMMMTRNGVTSTAAAGTNLFSCFSSHSIQNLQSIQSLRNPTANTETASNLNSPTGETTAITTPNAATDDVFEGASSSSKLGSPPPAGTTTSLTLLDWIKSTDPNNKLHALIDETTEILSKLETSFKWTELSARVDKLFQQIENNPQMREIEGLTKRLEDLKDFLRQADKFLVSQAEINEGLQSNLQRTANLRDETVLHDLCRGHEQQLKIFRNNHLNLIEIASKISKAKLELIRVVHKRLNWIMQVQKQIADFDFQVQIYFKQLKRFNVRIRVLEQIKRAPSVYLNAIRETRRRQKFAKVYKTFANLFMELVRRVHEDETKRRVEFEKRSVAASGNNGGVVPIGGSVAGNGAVNQQQHFVLSILFRALNDKLDLFVNDSPLKFDENLPQIDDQELKTIEEEIERQLKSPSKESTTGTTVATATTETTTTTTTTATPGAAPPGSPSPSSSTSTTSTSSSSTSSPSASSSSATSSASSSAWSMSELATAREDANLSILTRLIDVLVNKQQQQKPVEDNKTVTNQTINEQENNQTTQEQAQSVEVSTQTNNFDEQSEETTTTTTTPVATTTTTAEITSESAKLAAMKSMSSVIVSSSHVLRADLDEMRKRLEETKTNFVSSKHELDQVFAKFVKFEPERRAKFYANVLETLQLQQQQQQQQPSAGSIESADDIDREFVRKLSDEVSRSREEHEKRVSEVRQTLEQMKKSLVAEKQIQFNEAIKRVSNEKDRQIDELKTKQAELMSRVQALEKELTDTKRVTSSAAAAAATTTSESSKLTATLSGEMISTLTSSSLDNNTQVEASSSKNIDNDEEPSEEANNSGSGSGGGPSGQLVKCKLREAMLKDKVRELEKQLAALNTLPVTNNFYETVQLNSCNVDDLVLAVFSEEHNSYKVVYKTSNYLHFVHSIVMKNNQHRLFTKINLNVLAKEDATMTNTSPRLPTSNTMSSLVSQDIESPIVESPQQQQQQQPTTTDQQQTVDNNNSNSNTTTGAIAAGASTTTTAADSSSLLSPVSPTLNADFASSLSGSTWFIGKVILKEFCIAKKDQNRFKVPSGTRFYRVKLKPYLY